MDMLIEFMGTEITENESEIILRDTILVNGKALENIEFSVVLDPTSTATLNADF